MTHRFTLVFGMCVAALLALPARAASAQTLSVSGSPGLLRVSNAVAGSDPIPVSSSITTYTVTTTPANRLYNVTAQLDAPMPPGVSLLATFDPPPGATSMGAVALTVTATAVVSNIPRRTDATMNIVYQLNATAAAGVVPVTSRVVTLTIVQSP